MYFLTSFLMASSGDGADSSHSVWAVPKDGRSAQLGLQWDGNPTSHAATPWVCVLSLASSQGGSLHCQFLCFFFFFNSKSWKGSNWCSPRDCPAHQGILLAGGESATLLLLNLERMAPYHGDDSNQLEGEDLSSALCSLLAIYFLWIDILLLCSLPFTFLQVHIPTSLDNGPGSLHGWKGLGTLLICMWIH